VIVLSGIKGKNRGTNGKNRGGGAPHTLNWTGLLEQ